jgi:DeoR family glycerol-3-phosphate regulon repressor
MAEPPSPTPRQARLLALVRERGFAPVEALAGTLGVSAQTVRRDVARLTELRLLQRFHGGAGLPAGTVRPGWGDKHAQGAAAKAAIGAAAAAEVPPGASVFLDVGTTVEAAAAALARRGGPLRVVTASLRSALLLAGVEGVEVIVPGGVLRGADGSLAGGATLSGLEPMRVDIALLGCSGFDAADGAPMDWDAEKVAVKRAMIAASRRILVLADSAKLARPALIRIAPATAIAAVVTEGAPPDALAAGFAAAGVAVLRAGHPSAR